MREIVLGTAGHVDHGKTSLVKALTGIETDRLKEEKKRGITIELGFAYLDLDCGHRLGIVDVPGHEKFIRNMVAGAAGIDLVAFVIAADEGIMPQTREHFEICSLLGIEQGVIILTKIDMVDEEWLELVEEDVKTYFKGSFLENAAILKVSSTTGQGIKEAKETLNKLVKEGDFSQPIGPFRLPIDRIFSIKGFGAVVTGTSISGSLKIGDEITIYPDEKKAKVRGIQVHGEAAEMVSAGRRTAINVQGLETEMIDRGDMLASADSMKPSFMLDCEFLYLSSNAKSLKNRARVRVHIGTSEIMGRIVLLENEEAVPGERINVQLLLEEPVAAWPGDHYVVRSYSPVRTIGGGLVFNSCPGKKRRRFKEINSEIFSLYKNGDLEEIAIFHIRESGFAGMTFAELEVRLGIFGKRLKKILNVPVSAKKILVVDSDKQRMIDSAILELLVKEAKAIISSYHQENAMHEGISKEELRSRLYNGLDQKLFNLVLTSMNKEGSIVVEEASIRLASHQVSLQADVEMLRKEMQERYLQKGFAPPTRKEIVDEFSSYGDKIIKEMFALLVRENILIKVTEDLYYHTEKLAELKAALLSHLEKHGEMDAQAFKTMTNLSRKFSIPLLEYFDRSKLTIRVGDKRVLR